MRDRAWMPAAAIAAVAYGWLALRSQAYGDATLFDLGVSAGLAFAASVLLWWHCVRRGVDPPLGGVLAASFVFHGIGFLGFPVLEDDFFRYLWDGYVFATRGSPYGVPPADFFAADVGPRFEAILDGINNPGLATIYGPVCQWVFRLGHAIDPGALWPVQLAMTLASFGCVLALAGLARPRDLMLFAWSPLLVKEFAFTAHTDVLGVLPLLLACRWRERSPLLVGGLLALAVGAKVFALPLVPFLLRFSPKGWCAFGAGLALLYAPFVASGDLGGASLAAMGSGWLFNAPLYVLAQGRVPDAIVRFALLGAFAVFWAALLWRHVRDDDRGIPRGDWIYGALFLCAPALNPWYLAWLLPFAALRPTAWAWVASIAVLVSYAQGLNLAEAGLEPYEVPTWALLLEFVPIAIALGIGGRVRARYFSRSE